MLIGACLAEAGPAVEEPFRVYARAVGEAFQLRDDLVDGEGPADAARRVEDLVGRARSALEGAPLEPEAASALAALAGLLVPGP